MDQPARHRIAHQDQYCFVYGNDYKAALSSLGAISGKGADDPQIHTRCLVCRYWDYTSDEFLDIIRGYDKNDFPLDNIVFDMGWHTNDATVGTGHNGHLNWNGYTWNRGLIPDPEALIDSCHARGVTVSLNDHPHDGMRPHENTIRHSSRLSVSLTEPCLCSTQPIATIWPNSLTMPTVERRHGRGLLVA